MYSTAMRSLAHFWVLLPILSLTLASPLIPRAPLRPSEDAFYQPPAGFESTPPGQILANRSFPGPVTAFRLDPVNLQSAHQLLYRSTDSHGNAIATVTTVLVPHNANFSKLLSYQVAEDAASINCAPSYALQFDSNMGGFVGTIVTQAEILLIEAGLEQGWVVAVPDFEGPKGAYVANTLAGQAVLDGIRAAVQSQNVTGLDSDPVITMWGYSGGSLASGRAAELQPTYAPELKIAGAALGGTVPNISHVLKAVNKQATAGLVPTGIMGLYQEYPEMAALVDQSLIPSKAATFKKVTSQCFGADVVDFLFQDITTYFTDPSVLFANPTAIRIEEENGMGKAVPTIPLLVYKSVNDEVSPVADTDDMVSFYCQNNARVDYKRDIASEHGILAISAAPEAISWLEARMNGEPVASGCTKSTQFTALTDPGALHVLPQFLIDALLDLANKPVGPVLIG